MHQEYQWSTDWDRAIKSVEDLDRANITSWLDAQRPKGPGYTHLTLALASARYIDHHGPYLGHGTFNGGPILRGSSILDPAYQDLALLQTATYVVDLLHNPNYGPYLLLEMAPVSEPTLEASRQAFLESLAAGDQVLLAEHRLIGLLRQSGSEVAPLLTYAGLVQYTENEHRILIIHRSLQLLEDTNGWAVAEPILRAAVQYLASRPGVVVPKAPHWPDGSLGLIQSHDPVDRNTVMNAVESLIEAPFGTEPDRIRDFIVQKINPATLYEAINIAASEILCRTQFDAHAVTGVHCIMDLLQDPNTGLDTRNLAWLSGLSGSRIRRQKAGRSEWRTPLPVSTHRDTLDALAEILRHDADGLHAMQAAATYLVNGGDPTALTRVLMEVALTTAGPFDAIHNVKMLWGQLLETRRSRLPQESWRHLAAGARVVAQTAAVEHHHAEPILEMWAQMHPGTP